MLKRLLSRSGKAGRLRSILLIGLIPAVLGLLVANWPPTETLEMNSLDLLFQLRGPRTPPGDVCVVAIDDASHLELEVPLFEAWPRDLHAELTRTLKAAGARAIAFDVVFEDPGDPVVDIDFEFALAETGIVALGSTVELTEDPRFRETRVVEPHEAFAAAAAAVADVDLPTGRDGVIRMSWLAHDERASLALAAFEIASGEVQERDPSPRWIDYYGPARTIPTVSVYQALDPAQYLPPGFFRDKIVFVGLSQPTAVGEAPKDAFLTPFRGGGGGMTYGVEIHATLAANLLEDRQVRAPSAVVETLWLLFWPLLAGVVLGFLRPVAGGVALILLELLPWAIGAVAFSGAGGVWLPLIIPTVIQLPIAYVVSLLWYYLTTVRDRERIRRAFGFYLSPEMIQRIADDPDSLNLGGEEIVATAVFTDIKGFTSIAEKLTAPETAGMLNEYFSAVTRHVFESSGTLIKFIGDAVFAIWGAPIYSPQHATQACAAALAMSRVSEALGDSRAADLVTRIGVHTGPMLVGNLGADQRFDYTAIGDAVNLSARLEGLNKKFGTTVLISGDTYREVEESFEVRPLGRGRVVGRREPVEIHELLAERGGSTSPSREELGRFAEALAAMQQRRFDEAERGFREVVARRHGSDGPSAFYLDWIARVRDDPDWDGVVTFDSK